VHIHILHVYATFETLYNQDLRGKPFLVLHPERLERVWDCSPEAEAKGILPGMLIQEAHKKARTRIRVVTAHPDVYTSYTQSLKAVYHTFSRLVEFVPPAHAFLDLSEFHYSAPSPVTLGEQIRSTLQQAGYIAKIGIAHGKIFAELAAYKAISGGYHDILAIPSSKEREFIHTFPLSIVRYICTPTLPYPTKDTYEASTHAGLTELETHLTDLGITTFHQIAKLSEEAMLRRFGSTGVWLWHVAQGEDQQRTRAGTIPTTQNARMRFHVPLNAEETCMALQKLVEALSSRLQDKRARGKTLALLLWRTKEQVSENIQPVRSSLTLTQPSDLYDVLLQHFLLLFVQQHNEEYLYTQAQVRISDMFTEQERNRIMITPALLPPEHNAL
jgi:nucleotidyltransferase/DNA polymerase involved in DNA repair